MTVKTGQTWAGAFVTLDATGALEAGTPSGVLYIDGTADAATVTITGSNPYKWAVTLPSLTAGQRVDMYITGTIDSVATAGFVASEQADTALVSEVKTDTAAILADTGTDGVKIASAQTVATVTNLTNLPAIPANWLTGTGVDATAATKIQSGLATSAALTTVDNEIGAIDANVTAIKAKTDNLPANTTTTLAAIQSDLDNPAQYKADVSGLATTAHVQEVEDKVDIVDGIADAILDDTGTTGVLLSTSALTSIFDDETVVGSYTMRDLLTIMSAALAGKLSGGGTTTLTFRSVDDTSDVIVTTVDANKNRTNVVITV